MKVVCLKNNISNNEAEKCIEYKEVNSLEQMLGLNILGVIPEKEYFNIYHPLCHNNTSIEYIEKIKHDICMRINARYSHLFPNNIKARQQYERRCIENILKKLYIDFHEYKIEIDSNGYLLINNQVVTYQNYYLSSYNNAESYKIDNFDCNQIEYYMSIVTVIQSYLKRSST